MFFLTVALVIGVPIAGLAILTWMVSRLLGRRWGRKVTRISLYSFVGIYPAVAFLIIPFVFAQLLSSAGTRPQDVRLNLDPARFGCAFEEVAFPGRDGVQLSGWWMPGDPERTAFIIAHGLFRDRKEVTERGCRLNQRGASVLVYDLRGHGKSGEAPITMGYQERFDVLGAARFVHESQPSGLAIMGVSMGAAATLMAVPEMTSAPVAIIADSSFTSLWDTVQEHSSLFLGAPGFPFNDVFVWNLTRLGRFAAEEFDLPLVCSRARSWPPTLLVYGGLDERMSPRTARALLAALPTEHKQLIFFDEAGHGHAWESDPDRYLSTIESFLEEHRVELDSH